MISQRWYHLVYVSITILLIVALVVAQTANYLFTSYQRAHSQHEADSTLSFLVSDLADYFSKNALSDTKMLGQSLLYTLSHERTRVTNVRILDDTRHLLWSLYPTSPANAQDNVSNMAFLAHGCVLHVYMSYLLDPFLLDHNWFVLLTTVVVLSFVLYEMLRALLFSDLLLGLWAENETALQWMQDDFSKIIGIPRNMGDRSSHKQLVSAQGINETYAHLLRRYHSLCNSETDPVCAEKMGAVFDAAKGNSVFLADKPHVLFVWGCNAEGRWLVLLASFLAISMFFGISRTYFSFSVLVSWCGWMIGLLTGRYMGQHVSKRVLLTLAHVVFAYSMILYFVGIFSQDSYQFFPAISWLAVGVLSSIFMLPPSNAAILVPPHERPNCPLFAIWCGLGTLSPVVQYFIHVSVLYGGYERVWMQLMYSGMVWLMLLFYSWFFAKRHPAWGSVSHTEDDPPSSQRQDLLVAIFSVTAGFSIGYVPFFMLFQPPTFSPGLALSVVSTCLAIQRIPMRQLMFLSLCLFVWIKILNSVFLLHDHATMNMVFISIMGTLVMYVLSQTEQQRHLWHPLHFCAFVLGMLCFYLVNRYGWTDPFLLGVYLLNYVVLVAHRKQVCAPG